MQNPPSTHFCDHRFIVISRLGDGGAAAVWRVVDSKYDIERAVKTLHVSDNLNALPRFEQEVRIMMRLQSPNIVTVFESFVEDERLHIVMEKCSGSLDTWSKLYGPMPVKLAVSVLISMLKGLQVAHSKGVVHRDIKPHNVLIAEDGTVKLADFGLALLYLSPESLTKTGALLGSLAFMSPEQRINPSEVTPATDIYSATMTLVWLLEATNIGDLYLPDTLSALREKYPDALVDIIEKGGRHKPEERYSSAQEMIQALKAIEHTLPESEHSLMGLQLVEVSIQDLTPVPSQPALDTQSTELQTLNSLRWMLMLVVVLLIGISGAVIWQLQSAGTEVVVPQAEEVGPEIPMCEQPIRSFNRLTKLGPQESVQVLFEDLNQDGKQDAFFVNQYSQSLSVYFGNEKNLFEDPMEVPMERSRSKPIVADFNNDGLLDIVSLHIDLQRIQVHWGIDVDGTQQWKPPTEKEKTVLLQIPSPYEGMAYDGNEDGLLDLYLIAQNIGDKSHQVILRTGDADKVFNNHEVLATFPAPPILDSQYPMAFWLEDGALMMRDMLDLSQAPTELQTGLTNWKLHQGIVNRQGDSEVYLTDPDRFIYRWSESTGVCQVSEIPLSGRDAMYEQAFGYWDDNDSVDILATQTCMFCTSNHVLLLGN